MKKILLTAVSLCLILVLTSCSGTVKLNLNAVWGKTVNETLTYNITFEAPSTPAEGGISFSLEEGKYTSTIESSSSDEYAFEVRTETVVKGSYTVNGQTTPFTDTTNTLVRFKGVTQYSLFPVYSEKKAKNTTVVNDSGSYVLKSYDILSTTTYDLNEYTAVVTVKGKNESTGEYDQKVGNIPLSKTFKKLDNYNFFDNEMLTYAIRAMEIGEGFSASFATIDPYSSSLTELSASAPSENAVTEMTFNVNGQDSALKVLQINVALTDTMRGSDILCYYALNDDSNDYKSRLYMLKTSLPFKMGTLVYTLSELS